MRLSSMYALVAIAATSLLSGVADAQSVPASDALRWRMIGPHRGGRTKSAVGVPSQPNIFYIGVTNGGVWKTTDYGRTWKPIFDAQPTGSIGAVDVAPSNPEVIYVGSGEGLQRPDLSTGDGIYKSTDAGATWTHLGLRDGQQIPRIIVDPRNPERLFVAVLGHPYGPNAERGIYRSTNGGQSFEQVLYKDENTGGADLQFAPNDPNTIYAVLWESRQAPWENGVFQGPGSGLYKSTDGGSTWRQLTKGLPTFASDGLGRIGIAIAPSNPDRLYATVDAGRAGGIYRSDDAGESWTRANTDNRVWGRASDFAAITVDPTNADIAYSANVQTWKTTDGGKNWTPIRGAPGGDDYQRLWINPGNPKIMLLVSDQGALVTVNGGDTWSSWYNQATAQFYHVSTDNAWPYRVCGGQQESGSACVSSRGPDGQVNFRDWHPVGVEEYGYVAPDPLDPDIVYGGKVSRYDRRTGQVQNVAPKAFRSADYRLVRTAPVLFSPTNPRKLYFASNTIWETTTGGASWKQISGDLTRTDSVVPPSIGAYATTTTARARHPGVIYTIAPSPVDSNTIWAGTDDGFIQVTRNGGRTWTNVTPPGIVPWAKVSVMDASHTDANTAYAAVNTLRLDDLTPHIWRTRDGGKTWTHIADGIPDGQTVNAVKEDPKRRGLLFAGTELTVYVSVDDGNHWQSLRRNLPAISVRDLVIKDDDLVIGTHGRGFWILDNITPLRQHDAASAGAYLDAPQVAVRVRRNMYTDTPIPQEEPSGENPPDGAIVDYWLAARATGAITLEVLDATGALVRRYASNDSVEPPLESRNIPDYWIRPPQQLSADAGMHRFLWDLRYPPPNVANFSYPIAAAFMNTEKEPHGSWVLPGIYTVRLTVDGVRREQRLVVRMDPRVKTPSPALLQMFTLSRTLDSAIADAADGVTRVHALRAQVRTLRTASGAAAVADALTAFDTKLAALEGPGGGFGGGGGGGGRGAAADDSFARLRGELAQLFSTVEDADAAPTSQVVTAVGEKRRALAGVLARWQAVRATDLPAMNAQLRQAGLGELGR